MHETPTAPTLPTHREEADHADRGANAVSPARSAAENELAASVLAARAARKAARQQERLRQAEAAEARRVRVATARLTAEMPLSDGRVMTREVSRQGQAVEVVLSSEVGVTVTASLTASGKVALRLWRDGELTQAIDYPAEP